jgi:hypothetical protein
MFFMLATLFDHLFMCMHAIFMLQNSFSIISWQIHSSLTNFCHPLFHIWFSRAIKSFFRFIIQSFNLKCDFYLSCTLLKSLSYFSTPSGMSEWVSEREVEGKYFKNNKTWKALFCCYEHHEQWAIASNNISRIKLMNLDWITFFSYANLLAHSFTFFRE